MDDHTPGTNPGPETDPPSPEEFWPADPGAGPAAASSPEPPGEASPKRPSWKAWVAVGASAAVVGAAAVFGISAATTSGSSSAATTSAAAGTGATQGQNQGPGGRFAGGGAAFGTIAGINGSTLTVKGRSGPSTSSSTTKVLTSSSTSVTTSATGTLADVKVGDTVMVTGTGAAPDITATRVTDEGKVSSDRRPGGSIGFNGNGGPPGGGEGRFPGGRPPGGQGPAGQAPGGGADTAFTRGVVQSVAAGSFTLTGIDGSAVTVTTSSATVVTVSKPATVADLKVGDRVAVIGKGANGTITATSIREGALGGGFRRRGDGFAPPGAGSQ